MPYASQYHNYQKQKEAEVLTASPVQLVGMLLEGALLLNKRALLALHDGKRVEALENVTRSSKIVQHLYNVLDFDKGGDIAGRLGSLYSYILDEYVSFLKSPRAAEIDAANRVITTILEGWKKIGVQGGTP